MDIRQTPLLSALAGRLEFLSARTGVLAENIANADTPDFVARDLRKTDTRKAAPAPALTVSNARHVSGGVAARGAGFRAVAAPDGEASINGNQVSVETEMMKLSQTRQDYQLASTIYRKSVELIRFAARGGR